MPEQHTRREIYYRELRTRYHGGLLEDCFRERVHEAVFPQSVSQLLRSGIS